MLRGMTILYAEDEEFIRENIKEVMEFMQINVIAVANGEEAYKAYVKHKPDIVITDIEMPNHSGLEFIEKIRKTDSETPIIITSAYTNTEYFLRAVELNLVKYIVKPVTLLDLKEALNLSLQKLKHKQNNTDKYFDEDSYYNTKNHKLFTNNKEIKLNFHEINLLELLLKHQGHIVSYEQIEQIVWSDEATTKDSIRTLVKMLRQKLPPNTIENISKLGYSINLNK